nr:DUF4219 domain-containing protein/UBN2 domain-containing protein [Tanacetum cinerariifolium]
MSRDVLTVGSTMRIPLLYREEYSQWVKRFMNYLEEQTDGEAMINSIKNGDQPLPRVTQVSIAGTTSIEQPPLKDKFMWSDQEKRVQKINRLARSLLIQRLSNDIYSLIDSNKTAKDLWDALARHMLGSEYDEQDMKAAVLYESAAIPKIINKNLMDINIDALYNILKQNQGDVNDAMGSKKKTIVITSDPLALIDEKTNVSRSKEKVVVYSDSEGSKADDFSELKKIIALLAKAFNQRKFYSKPTNNNLRTSSTSESANKKQEFVKSDDKQVVKKADEKNRDVSIVKCYKCKKEGHFRQRRQESKAEDQAWMESSSHSDQEINANMVFMAQIEKVLSDFEASSSFADEKIFEEKYAKLEAKRYEYMIRYSIYFDNDKQHRKQIADQQVLYDKMSVQLVELDKHVRDLKNTVSLKPYVSNVILEKIIIDLEDEVVNLLEKEKVNMEAIESLKLKGFESSENVISESENQSENDCLVVEKERDKKENSNVIAPGMFKLNVSQCGLPISMSKSSCDSNNVEIKLKRKRLSDLDTFISVRRPKNSGVMWKKKGSSNTFK